MKNPAFHLKIFREVVSSCERRGEMMSPLPLLYAVHMLEGHLCTFGAGHRSHCSFDLFMSRSMMRLGFTFLEPKELEKVRGSGPPAVVTVVVSGAAGAVVVPSKCCF